MLASVILTLHLMIAAALVGVVLLQRSEGGGLGMGSSSGGFMTGRGTANLLTRVTAALAAAFFVTSISLTLLAKQGARPVSPLDQPGILKSLEGGKATLPDKSGSNVPAGTTAPAGAPPASGTGTATTPTAPAAPATDAGKAPVPKSQ